MASRKRTDYTVPTGYDTTQAGQDLIGQSVIDANQTSVGTTVNNSIVAQASPVDKTGATDLTAELKVNKTGVQTNTSVPTANTNPTQILDIISNENNNMASNILQGTGSGSSTGEETTTTPTQDSTEDVQAGTSLINKLGNTWTDEASQYADNYYQQLSEEARAEYSTKAAELATTANENQLGAEMQAYTNAQTREKLGWTGGYVLDQERQLEILRTGIQAQLFNQQELNRIGLESQLAAARLNADLKNTELAHTYYNEAVTNAINIANTTGYYLSAEAMDYLEQKRAAEQMIEMYGENSAEYAKAQKVISFVDGYFQSNGLSEAGQKTASYILNEAQLEMEQKVQKQAALTAIKNNDDYTSGKIGLLYDASGNIQFSSDGIEVQIVDYSQLTNAELQQYLSLGTNNHVASQAADYKLAEIGNLFATYLESNSLDPSETTWNLFKETFGQPLVDSYTRLFNGVDSNLLIDSSYSAGADMTTAFVIQSDLSFGSKSSTNTSTGNTVTSGDGAPTSTEITEGLATIQRTARTARQQLIDQGATAEQIANVEDQIKQMQEDLINSNGYLVVGKDGEYFDSLEGYTLSQLVFNNKASSFIDVPINVTEASGIFVDPVTTQTVAALDATRRENGQMLIKIKDNITYNVSVDWTAGVTQKATSTSAGNPTYNALGNKLLEMCNNNPTNGEIVYYGDELYVYYKGNEWDNGYFGKINRTGSTIGTNANELYTDIVEVYSYGKMPQRWSN